MIMSTASTGLTKSQRESVDHFLHLFADIEKGLKKKLCLALDNRTPVGEMIKRYLQRNQFWADSAHQLWPLAAIRNLLTHHRSSALGYPVALTRGSVAALQRIRDGLLEPEPVSISFRKKVETVSAVDSLASILTLAFEKSFSQFPVITDGRFGGLITENEIIRWLGRRVKANSAEVNLAAVTVKTLLKEKDPFLRGIPIFHFERLDASLEEVMGQFAARPMLEVVLLTESGTCGPAIEGIITQWDAARYPNGK
jgi:predicted transcriptional regulator